MEFSRRTFIKLLTVIGLTRAGNAISMGTAIEVTMHNDVMPVFDPVDVRISAGDIVRWTNKGILVHTVTFDPKQATKAADVVLPPDVVAFASVDLNQDDSYSHTFTTKGTYKYVCKYHEEMGMSGTVTVS